VDQDLTARANGPQILNGSALTSFTDSAGEHVLYIGSDGHVHQLYFNGTWVDQDLTALANGPQVLNYYALTSFADSAGEHVLYIGTDNHVHQLYYSGIWVDQDLTAWANPGSERQLADQLRRQRRRACALHRHRQPRAPALL
jgi:hypothetical protein